MSAQDADRMHRGVRIRRAAHDDVPSVAATEVSAGARWRDIEGLAEMAEFAPLDADLLSDLVDSADGRMNARPRTSPPVRGGLILVAVAPRASQQGNSSSGPDGDADEVVGFVATLHFDNCVFVKELDVAHTWQGRGIGRRLLEALRNDPSVGPAADITLTTFKNVSWNAPWYSKVGFEIVPAFTVADISAHSLLGKEHAEYFDTETRALEVQVQRGFERCVMIWRGMHCKA